jgi:hypothetical protein
MIDVTVGFREMYKNTLHSSKFTFAALIEHESAPETNATTG